MHLRIAALCSLVFISSVGSASAQSLRGSHSSLDIQNRQALRHDFSFMSTGRHVERFVSMGLLVPVRGNVHYRVHNVRYPYVRPEVKTFIERLASQYHSACGEQLVVTSATRPHSAQPRNASPRSVHPTGMAVDLRKSDRSGCRRWLEDVLLELEKRRVIEATSENRPPHYHVAIFPEPYSEYVSTLSAEGTRLAYRVQGGDTLWGVARRYGVSVREIQAANRLASVRIVPGQILSIPTR